MTQLRVVTVGFRNPDDLKGLLDSFLRHLKAPTEVLVWDNGGVRTEMETWLSAHRAELERAHLQVAVLGKGKNLGFAAAVNRAAEHPGDFDTLFMINPDGELASDVTPELLVKLMDPPGIRGLRVFDDPDKESRQASARAFPSLLTAVAGREGLLTRFWPRNPFSTKYLKPELPADAVTPVDWVSGSAMMVARGAWTQLKGFDESFFLYIEDVDLGRRAQALGIPVGYAPFIDVVHRIRGSAQGRLWKSDFHQHLGMWVYFVKWSSPFKLVLGPFIFLAIWIRFLFRRLVGT